MIVVKESKTIIIEKEGDAIKRAMDLSQKIREYLETDDGKPKKDVREYFGSMKGLSVRAISVDEYIQEREDEMSKND